MEKPTVFLSHSSKDSKYLTLLKNQLEQRTSGTVNIFLSSDGQSIPFGSNWVHSVEKALENTTIMFVAISPSSISSSWIFFECGYSYSRGVKVVPIGIMGASVELLHPPLSLLQGFNIRSHEGLNNIITVINREYDLSFNEDFTLKEYEQLSQVSTINQDAFNPGVRFLEKIEVVFPENFVGENKEKCTVSLDGRLDIVESTLNSLNFAYSKSNDLTIHCIGMIIQVKINPRMSDNIVEIAADPLVLEDVLTLTDALSLALYGNNKKFWFIASLHIGVSAITTNYKLSTRLSTFGVNISQIHGNLFEFENIEFAVEEEILSRGDQPVFPSIIPKKAFIRVIYPFQRKEPLPLNKLLCLLEEAGVIFNPGT